MTISVELPAELQATMDQIQTTLAALKDAAPKSLITIEGRAALSVARAAAYLDISEASVRRMILSGALHSTMVGSIYLISAAEIKRFLGVEA